MPERTPKTIRINADAKRLLPLLAAFEERTEGEIIEEALAAYLQIKSLSYGSTLPEARELGHTTPDSVGDVVERLTGAIERALGNGQHTPEPRSQVSNAPAGATANA